MSAKTKPASNRISAGGLRFEPHNGFGKKDPDGEPWPFGYISTANPSPVFELNVIINWDRRELQKIALAMAAAPELLSLLKEVTAKPMLTEGDDWWNRVLAAIHKAEGRS